MIVNLQELHERTGISKRKLRYCLDHQLVPGLNIEIASGEVGRPRSFHEDVGFGLVCAARLQELGLPHETIRRFLGGLVQLQLGEHGVGKPALAAVLERGWPARAHLGDSVNVRLVVDDAGYDSKWFAPGNPAPLSAEYRPTVEVVLDLGVIRDEVFGSP
ncbi:MAG: hypothetical protein KDA79_03020 [Planctomycetaceae bacterium]|nr:hypothetical protein [Planctomycetaceae bacterium]